MEMEDWQGVTAELNGGIGLRRHKFGVSELMAHERAWKNKSKKNLQKAKSCRHIMMNFSFMHSI